MSYHKSEKLVRSVGFNLLRELTQLARIQKNSSIGREFSPASDARKSDSSPGSEQKSSFIKCKSCRSAGANGEVLVLIFRLLVNVLPTSLVLPNFNYRTPPGFAARILG